MRAIQAVEAFEDASVNDNPASPSAEVISLENHQLLAENPQLAANAEEIGLNATATIQYIRQSLQLKEAEAQKADPSLLRQQHQNVVAPSQAQIAQVQKCNLSERMFDYK